MRNVNLNILKFLESMDNFCLSLSNMGLEIGRQETGVRRLFLLILPTPHTPHPTPYTLHPTPHP
ncbi:MAG: hypothetical protein PX640_15935 [Microcystis sp. M49629_WE12]|uniref:hypothetical protein n=1 Tax=Microcystis sp. LE19-10.1B TaxID=3016428 RepID=UPI002590119D|nr:hypothetical protein [Microcystis sp. LE19-10.1B]MDJ0565393.1 hypothetical protein [Microcystis sp. M49629_WE12]